MPVRIGFVNVPLVEEHEQAMAATAEIRIDRMVIVGQF